MPAAHTQPHARPATPADALAPSRPRAPQEWWFDTERLHYTRDLGRMRAAQNVLLEEAAAHGVLPDKRELVDASVLDRPTNDVGREMEVLLYGRGGGFAAKVERNAEMDECAVRIQCLYGSFALQRRIKRRREKRVLLAALFIQKLYRKRRIAQMLSFNADRIASAVIQHTSEVQAEQELALALAAREKDMQSRRETRELVLRRRLLALRSAVAEYKMRTMASIRLQCLFRTVRARRMVIYKMLEKRSRMRDINADQASRKAMTIQSRVRAHAAATELLTSHYEGRLRWYTDSRIAVMMSPLASHVSLQRKQLQTLLDGIAPEMERLAGSPKHVLAASKKLWSLQGEMGVAETLKAQLSLDALMKRRLEHKLALKAAQMMAERSEENYTATQQKLMGALEAYHGVRGSLEVIERLQLESETVTVMMAGQTELLRRKLGSLEQKLADATKDADAAKSAYLSSLRGQHMSANALALASSLLSRHVQQKPPPQLAGGEASQAQQAQPGVLSSSALTHLLQEKREAMRECTDALRRFEKESTSHAALLVQAWWAEGGMVALNSLHASGYREKAARLERRRSEALGHCIATANAKIAFRLCKQAVAELNGSHELVSALKTQQATMPRATLELHLLIPADRAVDEAVSERALEDVAMWMGVPDERFRLRGHTVTPPDDAEGKGSKQTLVVAAELLAGSEAGAPEPSELGELVVTEWKEGRLSTGFITTSSMLDVANVPVPHVCVAVPSREQLAAHMPSLATVEAEARAELDEVLDLVDELAASVPKEDGAVVGQRRRTAVRRLLRRREVAFFEARLRPPKPRAALRELREHSVQLRDLRGKNAAAANLMASQVEAEHTLHVRELEPLGLGPAPEGASRGWRLRQSGTGLLSVKGRLTYAKMRRDALRGKLHSIALLRELTVWPALRLEGDPHEVDAAWNKGVPSDSGGRGQFCAYCAQRSPPVLARHRYLECSHRQLAGDAEFSTAALQALEASLATKEARTLLHLSRFAVVVERRKQCKVVLSEVQGVLGSLGRFVKAAREPTPPFLGAPKSLAALCRPQLSSNAAWVRYLARRMVEQSEERTADLRELELAGGMHGGVWGELKALLVMTPRRALMYGGIEALRAEEARAKRVAAGEALTDDEEEEEEEKPSASGEGGEAEAEAEVAGDELDEPLYVDDDEPPVSHRPADPLANAADHTGRGSHAPHGRRGSSRPPAAAPATPSPAPAAIPSGSIFRSPRGRRGSLTTKLWSAATVQRVIEPAAVIRCAGEIGIELSERADEFYLLPLAVEFARAPLPGGWHEMMREGNVVYKEECTEEPQVEHPLLSVFVDVVKFERRRRRRMQAEASTVPAWLDAAADRWLQFVDTKGEAYFYNVSTAHRCASLAEIVNKARRDQPEAPAAAPSPAGPVLRGAELSEADSAAMATLEATRRERKAAEEQSVMTKLMSTKLSLDQVVGMRTEKEAVDRLRGVASGDAELRERIIFELKATFGQVVGASLATGPRTARQTLAVAHGFGINPATEAEYLWLADLAMSLPVPAGWVQVEHPVDGQNFWHNEISGTSQWQHPVDEFIKASLKMLRAPSHPQVQVMRRSSIGGGAGQGGAPDSNSRSTHEAAMRTAGITLGNVAL